MNINSVSNTRYSFPKVNNKKTNSQKVSFKGIFLDIIADPGGITSNSFPARFQKRDALLLNEIAQSYPNQDCFIRRGLGSRPRLEYRERPPEVQVFSADRLLTYKVEVDACDKHYPTIPLILYPNEKPDEYFLSAFPNLTFLLGVPSNISTNPSIGYTVKAGYEVHKKVMEKKFQIMDVVGRTDEVDFGDEILVEKAHKAAEDVEIAVTRLLLESAYATLMDRASARQIYESNYPKIQTRLDAKRRLDLTTSLAKQAKMREEIGESTSRKTDICEIAMKKFPNTQENKERIKLLHDYMLENGISLEDPENFGINYKR